MNRFKSILLKLFAFWRRKEPEVPANLIELHRSFSSSPDFKEYSREIWKRAGSGFLNVEMAFTVDLDGNYNLSSFTNEQNKLTLQIIPGKTSAIIHTHPNSSGPQPSTPSSSINGVGDTGIADKYSLNIYVVSSRGLWVYDWKSKLSFEIYKNIDWLLT